MISGRPNTLHKEGSDTWVLFGVLAVFAAMVILALSWIARYGYNLPFHEDWLMVRPLVGREPNLLAWLWEQNVEHREPLPKAVYLVLLSISGDFRIGMFANIIMLSGICLAMIFTARSARGGVTRMADAFFPLLLLHLGHWENIGWSWQITFVIATVLVCIWLSIVVRGQWPLRGPIAILAGLLAISLTLCGAAGLLFASFVVLWLIAGISIFHSETSVRWISPYLSGCVVASIVLVSLYFLGYTRPAADVEPASPGIGPMVMTASRLVGMAIGPVGGGRVSPKLITGSVFCVLTFLLFASSIIPLWRGLRDTQTFGRFRLFGFLVFAAAIATLVLVMAWGRAGAESRGWGLPARYALLLAPGLCAAYFSWMLYGPEAARNRVAAVFAIVALAAFPFNLWDGISWRSEYVTGMKAFEQDLSAGMPLYELAHKHAGFLHKKDYEASVYERMRLLHDAKIGPIGAAAPH